MRAKRPLDESERDKALEAAIGIVRGAGLSCGFIGIALLFSGEGSFAGGIALVAIGILAIISCFDLERLR